MSSLYKEVKDKIIFGKSEKIISVDVSRSGITGDNIVSIAFMKIVKSNSDNPIFINVKKFKTLDSGSLKDKALKIIEFIDVDDPQTICVDGNGLGIGLVSELLSLGVKNLVTIYPQSYNTGMLVGMLKSNVFHLNKRDSLFEDELKNIDIKIKNGKLLLSKKKQSLQYNRINSLAVASYYIYGNDRSEMAI